MAALDKALKAAELLFMRGRRQHLRCADYLERFLEVGQSDTRLLCWSPPCRLWRPPWPPPPSACAIALNRRILGFLLGAYIALALTAAVVATAAVAPRKTQRRGGELELERWRRRRWTS